MRYFALIVLIIYFFTVCPTFARYKQNANSIELFVAAKIYSKNFQFEQRDSVIDYIVNNNRFSCNDTFLISVYNWYLNESFLENKIKAHEYLNAFKEIADRHEEFLYDYYRASAIFFRDTKDYKSYLTECNKLSYYADASNVLKKKVECLLLTGHANQCNDNISEAQNYYSRAFEECVQLQDVDLIISSHGYRSSFFAQIHEFCKAKDEKLTQIKLLQQRNPIDSSEIILQQLDYARLLIQNSEFDAAYSELIGLITFADLCGNVQIKNDAFANLRTYLLDNNDIKRFAELYNSKYPGELLRILKDGDTFQYYKIKACIFEADSKEDSAAKYFKMAQSIPVSNKFIVSSFYRCYGQFFLNFRRIDSAIKYFRMSFDLAEKIGCKEYMIMASEYLDTLYPQQNKYREAYAFQNFYYQNKIHFDSLKSKYSLQVENLSERVIAAEKKEKEIRLSENSYTIQFVFILELVIFSFLSLYFLGLYRVPKFIIRICTTLTFIFFIKFIAVFIEYKFEDMTKHMPVKVLLLQVGVAMFLLPVHNFLEERTLRFLYESDLHRNKEKVKTFFATISQRIKNDQKNS